MATVSGHFSILEEAWLSVSSTSPSNQENLDLSDICSDENIEQSSFGAEFVEDILRESTQTEDGVFYNPLQPEIIPDSDSQSSTTAVESLYQCSSSNISDTFSSVMSDDEGYVSLDQCSASLSDFINPEDFNALLDTLASVLPMDVMSSAEVLDDACLNLAQCTNIEQTPATRQPTSTQPPSNKPSVDLRKPDISYIEMVAKAIMDSSDNSMLLGDIYQWIEDHYPYYKHTNNSWRSSIRHNLSVNECFVKAKRVKNGRGFYWSIHSSCVDAFQNGDFDRRKARRQVQQCNRAFTSAFEELQQIRNTISNNVSTKCVAQSIESRGHIHMPTTSTPVRRHQTNYSQINQYYGYHNYNNVHQGWH